MIVPDDGDLPHAPPINGAAFTYYKRLGRVREYVEANLGDHITLDHGAALACLSRSRFSSFFREAVGVTFMQWLTHVQVTAASDALREHDYSIQHVAERTFERAFKEWSGVTPHQYQAAHRPRGR